MAKSTSDPKVYLGTLVASKLMPESVVLDAWESAAKQGVTTAEVFADSLVATGKLSRYQADATLRGNKTFFLDDYKLCDRIGTGRMAGVYRAKHKLGMEVAVKILPPNMAKDQKTLVRFLREANMALKMDHPRIVKTYHAGNASGLHYLAMELLDGETLDERLERKKKLPLAEVIHLAQQTLEGLQHLADHNIVHRDLNPGNLMLLTLPGHNIDQDDYAVKVLDIGLGREMFAEGEAAGDAPGLTASGDMLGTPNYTAPEQTRDSHAADTRSDIYSLGCILYQCVAGKVPFPDKNAVRKLTRHATEMPDVPDYGPAPIALKFHAILWKMIAKKPVERYQTPAQAWAALQNLLDEAATPQKVASSAAVPGAAATAKPAEVPIAAPVKAAQAPKAGSAESEPANSGSFMWMVIGAAGAVLLIILGVVGFLIWKKVGH